MFKTTALDSVANAYVDKNVGASIPGTRTEADDRNILQDEPVAMVEETGQTLDPTGTIRNQCFLGMTRFGPAFQRAKFEYNDADQIDIGAAMYMCKDKYCFWESTLTSIPTGAAGGAEWWYLYLDYSAITSGTEITNAELIWSTTAPGALDGTYRQRLNGDDRCIFAVFTDAGDDILEFFHSDKYILYADQINVRNIADLDDSWIDVDMGIGDKNVMPAFAIEAQIWFNCVSPGGASTALTFWRTNGQTGAVGHPAAGISEGATRMNLDARVITDSSQIIEIKNDVSDDGTVGIYIHGWYFPIGM